MLYIFFIGIFFIAYQMVLYPFIIFVLATAKKERVIKDNTYFPSISVVCAAYNEEKHIENKIKSFLSLNYPDDKIELIIISDCSTDRTDEIVLKYSYKYNNIKLKIQNHRQGKPAAHNMIQPDITSDIVVLSDAASIFEKDSILRIVQHFRDKHVGLVSAKLIYRDETGKSIESIYWKFELFLRIHESKYFSTICASGALFALRSEYFTLIDPSSPDDFERVLITLENKKRAIYDPHAVIYDHIASKPSQEITRKIRIISSEWFVPFRHIRLLNPFEFPKITYVLLSHKIIRWLLPIFTSMILISSFILSFINPIFIYIFFLQVVLYLIGIAGIILEKKVSLPILFRITTYFIGMNYASLIGLFRFLFHKKQTIWETVP